MGLTGGALAFAFAWFTNIAPQYEKILDERFNARMAQQVLEGGWYRYSPELVAEFAKAGRTIFIDATADWCLTCKANEAAVLSDQDLLQKLDSAGVIRMKADWTRETPEVNALLKSMGKSGVPAYAIYPKGNASEQVVLPELLTEHPRRASSLLPHGILEARSRYRHAGPGNTSAYRACTGISEHTTPWRSPAHAAKTRAKAAAKKANSETVIFSLRMFLPSINGL